MEFTESSSMNIYTATDGRKFYSNHIDKVDSVKYFPRTESHKGDVCHGNTAFTVVEFHDNKGNETAVFMSREQLSELVKQASKVLADIEMNGENHPTQARG